MRIRTNHHTYSQHRITYSEKIMEASELSSIDIRQLPRMMWNVFLCENIFYFPNSREWGWKIKFINGAYLMVFSCMCHEHICNIIPCNRWFFPHIHLAGVPENCRLFVGNCINPIFWSSSSSLSSLHKMCQWTICYSSSILIIKFSDNHNEHRNWATVSWERRQKIFHRPNKTSLNSIQEEKSVRTFY